MKRGGATGEVHPAGAHAPASAPRKTKPAHQKQATADARKRAHAALEDSLARLRRSRWRLLVVGLGAIAVLVAIRVALDPIATAATRRGLARMDGFSAAFERVHVTVFSPGYTITRLKIIEHPGGDWRTPLFYAESVHVGIDWRQLLRFKLGAAARIVEPKISIVAGRHPTEPKAKAARAPDLSEQLGEAADVKIDRIEILRGELLFRDLGEPRHPELWVHHLEVAAENLATRPSRAGARPTTLSARGIVGDSGKLTLFVSADPFASPLAFAGRAELVGLRVRELFDFIAPKVQLQTPKGTLDLFADFRARNGRIEGGVKPVLKDVEVRPAEAGFWVRVKAWLADKTIDVASDRVPERDAVATTIPLEGRLTSPDVQIWPAVLGVVRNAFVEGLASGFAHLPPPKAAAPEAPLTQAKEAVKKDHGPPKAQPKPGDAPKRRNSAAPARPESTKAAR